MMDFHFGTFFSYAYSNNFKKVAKRDVVKWLKFAKKESSKIAKRGFPLGNFFAVIAFYRSLLLIFLFVA